MTTKTSKQRIRFEDGRRGYQHVDADGRLIEVVVTRLANGRKCQRVYARRVYLDAGVLSLSDLGNVTWQLEAVVSRDDDTPPESYSKLLGI